MNILAFDFGGTRGRCCLAAAGGVHGDVFALARAPEEDGTRWLARLLELGKGLVATAKPAIVTVSFGGPVTPAGRVLSVHVCGWEKIDLVAELKSAFKLPVCIENDANAGAVGEHRYGSGRGADFMAYLTVSTGIGGGVILGGKLYRGAHGMAGEFGHMTLRGETGAPQYASGKPGILEALASGPAIARDGRAALQRLGKTVPPDFNAQTVFDAARSGEPWAIDVRDNAVSELGRGIAAVLSAYDLQRVVIGGGVALAGDAFFVPLRAAVERFIPSFMEGRAEIVQAAFGDYSALLGAVATAEDFLAVGPASPPDGASR